jgi:hypothetical protein
MILTDISFKKLTVSNLKIFCKGVSLKNYSTLNKKGLFDEYNRYLAVKIIQHFYRKYFYRNAIDCITLEKVKYPCFIYRTKFGKLFFYNHDSIIKYIMKTGNTKDPMTRNEYTDEELQRLDQEAKYYFPEMRYRSTLKIKKNENYARRIRNRENEILSFQTRLDELKEILLHINNSEMYTWVIGCFVVDDIEYTSVMRYINTILYEFKLTMINLRNYDTYSESIFKKNILEQINDKDNFIYKYINVI